MPLPEEGNPISFNDLNIELGNNGDDTLDMDTVASEFGLEVPHGMNEFYGRSLLSLATSIVPSITSYQFPNTGGSVTINVTSDGTFDISESLSWISLSKTSGVENDSFTITASAQGLNAGSRSGTITLSSDDAPNRTITISQLARAAYLNISADTPSSNGGTYNVSVSAESLVSWYLVKDDSSFFVTGFSPLTGTGNGSTTWSIPTNSSGERSVTFTVGATNVIIPSKSVTVYQQTNTPTFFFGDWNGSVNVDGQSGIVFVQNGNSPSVSVTSTNPYSTVSTSTSRTISLTVDVPSSGYTNSGGTVTGTKTVTQPAYVVPTYYFSTWNGSVSVSNKGIVSYVLENADAVSVSPTSWDVVTSTTSRDIDVVVTVPSGYTNTGGTVSGTKTVNQSAVPAELTFTPQSSTTVSGNVTSLVVFVDDLYYDNTSWFIDELQSNSLQGVVLSPDSGVGSDYVIITFDSNNSGTRYGTFTLRGGSTSPSITITQNTYTPPPTISITGVTPSGPYSYEGQANIAISVSRTNASSFNASIAPQIQYDANAVFSEIQPSGINYYGPTSISGTGTSFKVEIPTRSDGTVNTYSSSLSVNVSTGGGNGSDSLSLEQFGLVVWNTSPSSLSFGSAQESLSVTLNTNLSWTAEISGTGFSIGVGDTSGTGTATFGILATNNTGGLRTGILSFSSPGQTTIQVTLTQDAYVAPTPVSWTRTPTSITWGGSDTFYDTIDVSFQNRTSTITWKAVLDSSQHFEISLSSSSGYGKQILSITNDDLIYVRPKDPNNTSVSYDDTINIDPVTTGTGLSTLTVSLSQSPAELGCLLQGTKITMSDNSIKRIQHLKIGDSLKSVNIVGLPEGDNESLQFQTDNLKYTQSTAIVTNITKLVRKTIISFNEGLLQSSIDHNHFIRRDGVYQFLAADKVFVGDYLMNEIGEFIEITLVEEYSDLNYIVYKVDVEEHDVFFANGILTHNAKIEF